MLPLAEASKCRDGATPSCFLTSFPNLLPHIGIPIPRHLHILRHMSFVLPSRLTHAISLPFAFQIPAHPLSLALVSLLLGSVPKRFSSLPKFRQWSSLPPQWTQLLLQFITEALQLFLTYHSPPRETGAGQGGKGGELMVSFSSSLST